MISVTSRRATALAAALLTAGSLAGCSDDGGGGDGGGEPAGSGSTSAGEAAGGTVSPPDLPTPPRVRGSAGAVADVSYDECGTGSGDQTVTGTVTNPTGRTLDYVVTVSWVTDTSDVVGRGFAVVRDVGGGESADWSIEAQVEDGATQCVPNVLRGTVRGTVRGRG